MRLKNSYHYAPAPLSARADGGVDDRASVKFGGHARTLILPHESIGDWELVLKHWCAVYRPKEDSLEFDFVLKVAQAEFRRLRADRNYDDFLAGLESSPPFAWSEREIKTHDLMQRYVAAANLEFQRQYRLLEHHYKTHKPIPAQEEEEEEKTEETPRVGIHAVESTNRAANTGSGHANDDIIAEKTG